VTLVQHEGVPVLVPPFSHANASRRKTQSHTARPPSGCTPSFKSRLPPMPTAAEGRPSSRCSRTQRRSDRRIASCAAGFSACEAEWQLIRHHPQPPQALAPSQTQRLRLKDQGRQARLTPDRQHPIERPRPVSCPHFAATASGAGLFRRRSISRILSSSSHPSERPTWTSAGSLRTVLFGLASGGVCPAVASPRRWCALTAPFHPCRPAVHVGRRT
jgi:hypothetical protein